MRSIFTSLLVATVTLLSAQTNIHLTNSDAVLVLSGHYDPLIYGAQIGSHPDSIIAGLQEISPDSLQTFLEKLVSFHNRNTGSDTLSADTGIGAARTWIYHKFSQFQQRTGGRIIPSFLAFDKSVCNVNQHKNVLGIIPGADTLDHQVVIIEAHMDSRCEDVCDSLCRAHGADDNGSGTVLLLELARVMSRYVYKHTIVFMATTGEEQGLIGAQAMADYCVQQDVPVKAVLNNDVVGGIICGQTASPPGCPGAGDIDSTHLRIYSQGGYNSANKQLARFVKLEYNEMLRPLAPIPMDIEIMTPEDRTGRGGDHIPFRQAGYTAIRFTEANEHGDADPSQPGYIDHQHTVNDVIGVDTDNDQIIDSFFVDFNYLARNSMINGVGAAMAAIGPRTPTFSVQGGGDFHIEILTETQWDAYRFAVRTNTNDWDTVITFTDTVANIVLPGEHYFVSVASVNAEGIESLFSREYSVNVTGTDEPQDPDRGIRLLPNRPNPFDESTAILIDVRSPEFFGSAFIEIADQHGRLVHSQVVSLAAGINEIQYTHGPAASGIYICRLMYNGHEVGSQKMVFNR